MVRKGNEAPVSERLDVRSVAMTRLSKTREESEGDPGLPPLKTLPGRVDYMANLPLIEGGETGLDDVDNKLDDLPPSIKVEDVALGTGRVERPNIVRSLLL